MDKKLRDLIHTFLFFGFLFNFGALLAPLAEVRQGQGTSYYPFAYSDFGILIVATGFISGVVASLGLLRLTILFSLIELGLCGCLHFFSKKLVGDASAFLSFSPVGPGIILFCQGLFFFAAFKKWKFESEPEETHY